MIYQRTAQSFKSHCVRILLLLVLACAAGCPTAPPELRYEAPKPGTAAATIAIGAGKTTHIFTVDGKEPPAFASSVMVSAGKHRVMIACAGPTSAEHLTVEGSFQEGGKYFARCEFHGDSAQLWLAGTPDGPPLPEFAGNPPAGLVAGESTASASFLSSFLPSLGRNGSIETASLEVPQGSGEWKAGSSSDRKGSTFAEFVPKQDSINNWTRLLTIQFIENKSLSPQAAMDELRMTMLKRCPAAQWTVTEQDATSVLYEWSIAGCAQNPDQYEMARLLQGHEGLQRVAIAVKGSALSPSERAAWLKTMSNAFVVKDGKRVSVAP